MTASTLTVREKVDLLEVTCTGELIERPQVISTQLLALIARVHHFQIGEPGVAKSLSVRNMVNKIGGLNPEDYFETLMTRFTPPEEVFGPFDISGLRETPSRYRRNTELMAPQAKFWFLDEIWKANSSILNSFLWALNEREFRNDGHVETLPLWSMFCASNEMPEGEELNALADRIHFWLRTKRIQEPAAFVKMLKLGPPSKEKILDWSEIETAAREADELIIGDDVYDAMAQIRNELRAQGIEPTDRRFNESKKVIRANAWKRGAAEAEIEDLAPLVHMLWATEDQFSIVEKILLQLANPLDKEAQDLIDIVEEISSELDEILGEKEVDGSYRSKKGVELHGKIQRVNADFRKLNAQVKKSKRRSSKIQELHTKLMSTTERMLTNLFGIDADLDDLGGPTA